MSQYHSDHSEIRVFCWLVLVAMSGGQSLPCEGSDRPNILFILADDMGWQDTSVAFGPERTPFNARFRTPAPGSEVLPARTDCR